MEQIPVLIADDEPGMRDILKRMVSKVDGYVVMDEAANGKELLVLAEKYKPRLVFLDVEMPEMTGVECARALQDMDPTTIVIFATAHDDYMGDAFEVYAFDYLVKPFKLERVLKTLERARDRLCHVENPPPMPLAPPLIKAIGGRLMLHHREGVSFIDLQDILLVQREDRSTVLYTVGDGRFVTSESLGEMEERLQSDAFFRCHKSYIINLHHIRDVTPYGRWTYVVRLEGTKHDALITHEKYDELEQLFR